MSGIPLSAFFAASATKYDVLRWKTKLSKDINKRIDEEPELKDQPKVFDCDISDEIAKTAYGIEMARHYAHITEPTDLHRILMKQVREAADKVVSDLPF